MAKYDYSVLKALANEYALAIMAELQQGDKRFMDLREAVPNTRTRTLKIKGLLEAGLIRRKPRMEGLNVVVFYQLTPKGETAWVNLATLIHKIV